MGPPVSIIMYQVSKLKLELLTEIGVVFKMAQYTFSIKHQMAHASCCSRIIFGGWPGQQTYIELSV